MNEAICFLNKNTEIQTVVYWMNKPSEYRTIVEILNNIYIDDFTIIGEFDQKFGNEIVKKCEAEIKKYNEEYCSKIVYENQNEFKGKNQKWALYTTNIMPKELMAALTWQPNYLFAEVLEGYTGAFNTWEMFKENTSTIMIKTIRKNKEPKMLVWNRKEESQIELSVVFPMYNVAAYLDECIKSVTTWKAPYVEFLFVNDGSPDNSRDIVLEWGKKDSRIKLLDKANGGCASAREFGLEKAKGQYVGFVDPDDFVDESMFRKLLRAAMIGSYDVSYCGYNEFYENTKTTKRVKDALGWPYCDGTTDQRKIWDLIMHCRVAIWRGIYKKSFLEKNKIHFYTDLRRFDDLPFKIEVFAAAKSVIAIDEYLYYYRLSRPGQDVAADDERLYVHFDIFDHLDKSIVSQKNQILNDCLQVSKVQTHLYAMNKIKAEFVKTYKERAKKDLNRIKNKKETCELMAKYIGKENAEVYKKII